MTLPVITETVIKVAARCNLNCCYCYWFRDPDVYQVAKFLSQHHWQLFVKALEQHIAQYQLPQYSLCFHGGEPLLLKKEVFESWLQDIDALQSRTGCHINTSVVTNAVLIDAQWCQIFSRYGVSVGVSMDGYPEIHDKYRIDLKGQSSSNRVRKGFNQLQKSGCHPYIMTVIAAEMDAERLLDFYVNELEIKQFSLLLPDSNWSMPEQDFSLFLSELYQHWKHRYLHQGVQISILDAMLQGLLGQKSGQHELGLTPITSSTLTTEGILTPVDYIVSNQGWGKKCTLSIEKGSIQELTRDSLWQYIYRQSTQLAQECQSCCYKGVCGGANLSSRWSEQEQFNNRSRHCNSLKHTLDVIQADIQPMVETIKHELEQPLKLT